MNTFTKYTLFQVPGWIGAGLILYAIRNWFGMADWIALGLFVVFVGKDFAIYPFVRRSYGAKWKPGPAQLIGEHGSAVEEIALRGYVRVRGELWQSELAPGAKPVAADAPVRVQDVRGDTLIVVPEP